MTKPFICKSNLYPQQHTECPGNHCPRASGFLQDSREEMQVLQVTFWSLLKMLSNGIKAVFKGRCQYRKDLQNLGAKTWFPLSDSKLSRDTSIKKKITTTKKTHPFPVYSSPYWFPVKIQLWAWEFRTTPEPHRFLEQSINSRYKS